ncbi:MAG: sigma-70 family RNA polymerase sigma factor [Oscillospiraceae bacterium]|nr:sigma-70 family RNA polymerase sigma factor [Oscillospiraceae bacterium]
MKSDSVYRTLQGRFQQCGVDIWDLKQSCYMAFLKAIEGYKPDTGKKFTSYLSYPFKNTVNELIGVRTQKQKNEPLNDCTSLDTPLKEDEPDGNTLVDMIADDNAVNAVELAELEDDYRVLHEAVDCLKYPQNRVINSYYFEDKSMKDIGAEMGISGQRISQILHKGLRCLRSSKPLLQLYRENQQHRTRYQTRPDMHLYITELEEKYTKLLHKTTA